MSAKPTLKMMRDAGVGDTVLQLCNGDIHSQNQDPKTLTRILPIKTIKGVYPYSGSIDWKNGHTGEEFVEKYNGEKERRLAIDIINGKIEQYNNWVENEMMNISNVDERLKFPYNKVQSYGKWELSIVFEMPINESDIFSDDWREEDLAIEKSFNNKEIYKRLRKLGENDDYSVECFNKMIYDYILALTDGKTITEKSTFYYPNLEFEDYFMRKSIDHSECDNLLFGEKIQNESIISTLIDLVGITAEDARAGRIKGVTFNKKNKPMDDIWKDGRRYKKGFKEGFIVKTLPEDWWIGIDIENELLHFKHSKAEILDQKVTFHHKSLGIGSNSPGATNAKIIMLLKYAMFQETEIAEDLSTHNRWVKIVQDDVKYKTIKESQKVIEKLLSRILELNDEFFTKKKYVMIDRDKRGKEQRTEYPFYVCNAKLEIITNQSKQLSDLGYNLDGTAIPVEEPDEDIEIEEDDNNSGDLSNIIRMMMKDDVDYFGKDEDEPNE
jgi:hypothetical protein